MSRLYYSYARSSLCNVYIFWFRNKKGIKIARVFLSKNRYGMRREIRKLFPAATRKNNSVASNISAYFEGKPASFDFKKLNNILFSKFQRIVYHKVRKIPYGKVMTYGTLASNLAVRSPMAVGNALAKNPFPIIIPCHRIVSSDRKLCGFQAGVKLKKALLKSEGITFDKKDRIPEKFFVTVG